MLMTEATGNAVGVMADSREECEAYVTEHGSEGIVWIELDEKGHATAAFRDGVWA